jgi:hypothetical protein
MIYLLNIFIYLLTPLGGVLPYCSLLRIAFDAIFGALLFLQCLFSLHMFVFMLPWVFVSVISLCGSLGCGMWVRDYVFRAHFFVSKECFK